LKLPISTSLLKAPKSLGAIAISHGLGAFGVGGGGCLFALGFLPGDMVWFLNERQEQSKFP
jgi:hypothetical protein